MRRHQRDLQKAKRRAIALLKRKPAGGWPDGAIFWARHLNKIRHRLSVRWANYDDYPQPFYKLTEEIAAVCGQLETEMKIYKWKKEYGYP